MTPDVDEARQLRQAVVRYVVQNWAANPDISEIMGAERRAIQPTILLQKNSADSAFMSRRDQPVVHHVFVA